MMRSRTVKLITAVAAVALAVAAPVPATAQEPTLEGVQIVGDPLVGSRLQAVLTGTVDAASVAYRWCHQGDRPRQCAKGSTIGTDSSYVPVSSDLGFPLLVKATVTIATFEIEVTSAPTAPVGLVVEPTPTTTPTPTDPPGAAPPPYSIPLPPADDTPAAAFESAGTTPTEAADGAPPPPSALKRLRYLRPFPVIRIRGTVAARGARISLLRVTAPRNAIVKVRCAGDGCPFHGIARGAGRIRALERFLRAGTRITIRVGRPQHIGKYVRLLIRAGRPPARRDACVLPGRTKPVVCPPA
jgi:hypothetical protein